MYTFGHIFLLDAILLHLEFYQFACQVYLAYVYTSHTLYGYPLPFFGYKVCVVPVKFFTAAFVEGYFQYRVRFGPVVQRQAAQPVIYI